MFSLIPKDRTLPAPRRGSRSWSPVPWSWRPIRRTIVLFWEGHPRTIRISQVPNPCVELPVPVRLEPMPPVERLSAHVRLENEQPASTARPGQRRGAEAHRARGPTRRRACRGRELQVDGCASLRLGPATANPTGSSPARARVRGGPAAELALPGGDPALGIGEALLQDVRIDVGAVGLAPARPMPARHPPPRRRRSRSEACAAGGQAHPSIVWTASTPMTTADTSPVTSRPRWPVTRRPRTAPPPARVGCQDADAMNAAAAEGRTFGAVRHQLLVAEHDRREVDDRGRVDRGDARRTARTPPPAASVRHPGRCRSMASACTAVSTPITSSATPEAIRSGSAIGSRSPARAAPRSPPPRRTPRRRWQCPGRRPIPPAGRTGR